MNISPWGGPSTRVRNRSPFARTMCWLAVIESPSLLRREGRGEGRESFDALEEVGSDVQRIVEHVEQAVTLALEDRETRVGDELDLFFQQVDARERIAIAAL